MAHVAIGDSQDNLGGVWQDKTQLYALAGNDTIISDNKNDFLIVGGSGDDSLIMYGGKGSISGGAGKDTFELTYSADRKLSAVIEDLDPANDKIIVNFDGDAAPQLTSSVSGNDVILRDGNGFLNVTLKGVRENDYYDGTLSWEAFEWDVLVITNDEREAKNLPWLTMSADLMQGASVRAQEITALGLSGILTDHTRPNGEDFSTVLEKEYVSPPHENLEAGAASAAEVMENWMDSKTHRENILNPNFNKLGVAYNYQDDGDPTHHRYYWTQLFADNLKSPETVSTADLLTANIEVNTVKKFVTLTENPDTYSNTDYSATIAALGGADSITNSALIVSISGGADNDTIVIDISATTVNAGTGDDVISLSSDSENNLIIYNEGDGNDTISGFKTNDLLEVFTKNFIRSTVGNDIIVSFGDSDGSITLLDTAATLSPPYIRFTVSTEGKFFTLFETNNQFLNGIDDATIAALGGNDSIDNKAANVSISGGTGDDEISNYGDNVTIDGDDGSDSIGNWTGGDEVSISGGAGNDSIYNSGVNVTIDAGAGDDTISNTGANILINGGADNDTIVNRSDGTNVTIDLGAGDDSVWNYADNVTILGSAGNDSIINDGASVTIDAGAGNDTVRNYGSNVTINGGDGNDDIENEVETSNVIINSGNGNDIIISGGSNLTINAGNGNDIIGLSKSARNNVIQYNLGDGDDTLWGYSTNTTLNISEENVTSVASGDNMIIYVGDGSITLIDAREKLPHIVLGAGGTSGGGSGSSGGGGGSASGGGSSSGSGGSGGSSSGSGGSGGSSGGSGGSGGSSGGSGGSGGSSGSGGSLGNKSAMGSRGRGTSTSSNTSGGNVRVTARNSRLNLTDPVEHVEFPNILTPSTQQTTTANQRIYSGGNQIISDYSSGEKIIFGDVYTGSFYDGAGNYCVGSSTGALVIQNAADKVIDLSDAAGNSFLKSYAATTAGVIDGRGLTGFEIINGSAGSDAIFAGDGGSQLWGGSDVVQDIMVGGGGTDIFIGGRTQGADVILNASSADIVHLNDASLRDIIATEENNGAIAVAFNTGNVVGVQSSELLSATFMLADGSA